MYRVIAQLGRGRASPLLIHPLQSIDPTLNKLLMDRIVLQSSSVAEVRLCGFLPLAPCTLHPVHDTISSEHPGKSTVKARIVSSYLIEDLVTFEVMFNEGTLVCIRRKSRTDLKDLRGIPFCNFSLADYGFKKDGRTPQCVDRSRELLRIDRASPVFNFLSHQICTSFGMAEACETVCLN